MKEADELHAAVSELRTRVWVVLEPPLARLVALLNRLFGR